MVLKVALVCAALICVSADQHPMDDFMARLTPPQQFAVSTFVIPQTQSIAARILKDKHGVARKLNAHESMGIPEACKAACPDAANLETQAAQIQADMMKKHESTINELSTAMAGTAEPTAEQLAEVFKKLEPMIKDSTLASFDLMCSNKETFTCIAANQKVCASDSSMDMGGRRLQMNMGMSDIDVVQTAEQHQAVMKCMCDLCPASKDAMAEMTAVLTSTMMGAMMVALAGGDTTNMEAQMQEDMLKAMCPMVGMAECFTAHPTECASAFETANPMSSMGGRRLANHDMESQMADLKQQCDAAGISTEMTSQTTQAAQKKVTTTLTLEGLDYAKVSANKEIETELISKVKARFLAKMSGYTASDLLVTLSAGSVKATVTITPKTGDTAENINSKVAQEKDNIANDVLTDVKAMESVNTILEDGATVDSLSASASSPVTHSGSGVSATTAQAAMGFATIWALVVGVSVAV